MPTYEEALKAAGATVIRFEMFGEYQGDWIAEVEFNGVRGFVVGSYGSCGGCDGLEATDVDTEEKLAEFGADYLKDGIMDKSMVIAHATQYDWKAEENKEKLEWINAQP